MDTGQKNAIESFKTDARLRPIKSVSFLLDLDNGKDEVKINENIISWLYFYVEGN